MTSVAVDQEPPMPTSAAGTSGGATALGAGFQAFLSFRGLDTRGGFTDTLYHALVDAGVRVFRDATSSAKWCLRELARIVEDTSRSKGSKKILPIFFDVEPDDVKLKTSLYSDALVGHQKKFPDEVNAWREALVEVGKIKGWSLKNFGG
ncbi:TMV resistance protein N-like [Eucalyptus grandis]|uniref:TMV resistance protein N-like n=1 Tax=Eucalyptus grandis TaxID=71139 RepID=UPI00192EA486|nr:TMV resistance protein N-like [Eucalyptus grandis]